MPKFSSLSDLFAYLKEKLEKTVDICEILDSDFMKKHTTFDSVGAFFDASGVKIRAKDDLLNADADFLDQYVAQNSDFSSWSDMYRSAAQCWVDKQLSTQ